MVDKPFQPIIARHLRDEQATLDAGATLAGIIAPGLNVYLSGGLGAGKTTLARGLLRELGIKERVKSPSYALVELYTVSRLNLYHFDFFRFEDSHEWGDAGFRDYFGKDAVCLVEWPERAREELPPADIHVALKIAGSGRDIEVWAETEKGKKCLATLRHVAPS